MGESAYDAYWVECIEISFDENEIKATDDQIKAVAADVQSWHENYGMSFPAPAGPHPLQRELDETKAALRAERDKVTCKLCGGSGWITEHGPVHSASFECWKCRGAGRHD